MYTRAFLIATALGAGSVLQAQDPHFGFALNLSFPTGDFRSHAVPANLDHGVQNQGFDAGIGGQFTISFPLERALALRLNFSDQVTSGSQTEKGVDNRDLEHNIFSIGAEFQFFVNGSANRHRGTYFYMGPCADFERWDYRNHDNYDYYDHYGNDNSTYDRKSRMGATFGIGNSFGSHAGRFTLEVGFHKTLTGNDATKGDPPSADFLKVSFGWIF